MRKWRSWARVLSLAGGLSVAGCADHGSYQVAWNFGDDDPAGSGCGHHGVDAIRVTGASSQGDSDDIVTLCAPGALTHEVPVGDWTLTLHQLDVRGRPIVPNDDQGQPVPDPTATVGVLKDRPISTDPPTVTLKPRPECSDGIDNDCDGRVDLDDDDCTGDLNTAKEMTVPGC
jgi:hypothetical protein